MLLHYEQIHLLRSPNYLSINDIVTLLSDYSLTLICLLIININLIISGSKNWLVCQDHPADH